jgi:lysozyme
VNFLNHNIHGPDISFYQDATETPQMVNFQTMKAAGAHFVIVKAGQRYYADPDFVHNWREAKAAGIPRGSYWFYDSRANPKDQAQKYWNLLESDPGELFHALDWEENYNGTYRDWQYVYDFLYWFKDFSKLPYQYIPVYTGYYYWIEHAPTNAQSLEWFKRHPLWLANYNPQAEVKVPPPWSECILWQYGTPAVGIKYGAESREIDMNLWNGDEQSFKLYFGLGDEPPPPVEPGETMKGKVIKLTNIRQSNTQFSDDMGDLLAGDLVEWTEEGTGPDGLVWIKLISATHNGAPVRCSDGNTVTGRYCWAANVEEINAPPAEEPPAFIVAHWANGQTRKYLPE